MEEPVAWIIRDKVNRYFTHVLGDKHRILYGISHLEEVTVQVHRMDERTMIDHVDVLR